MDQKVREVLRKWKLEHLIEKFTVEGIDWNSLLLLTPDLVKQLNLKIGEQALLNNNLSQLKSLRNATSPSELESVELLVPVLNKSQINECYQVIAALPATPSGLSRVSTQPVTPKQPESSTLQPPEPVPSTSTASDVNLSVGKHVDFESSKKTRKRRKFNPRNPSNHIEEPISLRAILQHKSGRLGSSLLGLSGDIRLKPRDSRILSKIIVDHELELHEYNRVPHSQFQARAKEVKELFWQESETAWYTPYVNLQEKGKKIAAKGKLIEKYYNLNKAFDKSGYPTQFVNDNALLPVEIEDPDKIQKDKAIQDSLSWLKTHLEPWAMVLEKCKETSLFRQELLSAKNALTVHDYMNEYPVFKQPLGYTLLELDFDIKYPEEYNNLQMNWPEFSTKLKTILLNAEEISEDGNQSNEVVSNASLLMKYSSAFAVTNVKVGPKKFWRPSRQEMQDGFLLHVKEMSFLSSTIQDLTSRYLSMGITLQPLPILVGKDLDNITDSYVFINKTQYKVESPLRAIDVAFKSFHALNATYPVNGKDMWLILQTCVYNISTKWDEWLTNANSLKSALMCGAK